MTGSPLSVPKNTLLRRNELSKRKQLTIEDITIPLNRGVDPKTYLKVPDILLPSAGNYSEYARFVAVGGGVPRVVTAASGTSASGANTLGGGTRQYIYGSAVWGSGHGSLNTTPTGEQENGYGYFWVPTLELQRSGGWYPFGFWPLCWGNSDASYMASSLWYNDAGRPGGAQAVYLVKSSADSRIEWLIVGDASTVKGLKTILEVEKEKGGCSVHPGDAIYGFLPDYVASTAGGTLYALADPATTRTGITITPQTTVQYYRSSSVVLGLLGYTNGAFSSTGFGLPAYWGRAPINYALTMTQNATLASQISDSSNSTYSTLVAEQNAFLECLNLTIAASVPIFDPTLEHEGFRGPQSDPFGGTNYPFSSRLASPIYLTVFFIVGLALLCTVTALCRRYSYCGLRRNRIYRPRRLSSREPGTDQQMAEPRPLTIPPVTTTAPVLPEITPVREDTHSARSNSPEIVQEIVETPHGITEIREVRRVG